MKLPGPDHPITITANPKRVRSLRWRRRHRRHHPCADAERKRAIRRCNMLPRADANMALLARTDRTTHCPYKGDASYFSINANGKTLENSIWTYETPFPAMAEIAGHLAFYPDKVDDRGSAA